MIEALVWVSAWVQPGRVWRYSRASIALPVLLAASVLASAQTATTTISGTVYDPRGASGLPLPNVLVYASTTAVAAPPSGLQCLTVQNSAPTGPNVVAYTYTAYDGTFTLQNIPENTPYTIVIQAGKWQRQFPETVAAGPLAGLVLSMPANHTEGNIPMIAIATGDADCVECVLRDMGISDTEFTDDTGSVNPGGHIHLYLGDENSGAEISSATPSENTLTTNSALMSSYDMVMFPSQDYPVKAETSTKLTNVADYANAGGRLYATDESYVWLDPDPPYDAQFPPVANWTISYSESTLSGVGTVQTNFSDGATLALWLQYLGATVAGTSNQIDFTNALSADVSTVIAPTQSWVTANNGSFPGQTGNPVLQMTFDTPVGSPASSQCGRVLYNNYHVIQGDGYPYTIFPTECPSNNSPSYTMRPQEKMLEYALFDLSGFLEPAQTGDFSLTFFGASSATVPPAGKAVYTLVVTPLGGTTLLDAVSLSATGIPPGATATFSPSTVPAGSGTTTVLLTIALPGSAANERPRGPFGGGPLPVALGLVLLPFIGRLRKGRACLARLAVLVVIGAALAAGFIGCGGKLAPQNFSFKVTAASGSLSHSVTPQLTVQ